MATKCGISLCACFVLHASAARIKNHGETMTIPQLLSHAFLNDSMPCGTEINMKKYGNLIKTERPSTGYKFWDSCPKEGANCAEGCLPYSGALGLTFAQRATKSIGHSLSGSCAKTCRYTDDTMMKTAEEGGAFAATSAAILEYKLALQDEGCGNFFSKASATCGARQRKIASIFGFLIRNLFKASTFAKAGEVSKCNAMLPVEIRAQLSTVFQKMVENMIAAGANKTIPTKFLDFLGRVPTLPQLCEKLHEMRSAEMSDPNATAKMKVALQAAAGGELSQEALEHTFATLQKVNADDAVNQVLKETEQHLAAVVDGTTETSSSLVQTDVQGWLHGLFASFWSFLLHGIVGTIFGSFTTLACLVSMGRWTDQMTPGKYSSLGITENQLNGNKRGAWLVVCPLQNFKVFWGLEDDVGWEWPQSWGLDWKTVKQTYKMDD